MESNPSTAGREREREREGGSCQQKRGFTASRNIRRPAPPSPSSPHPKGDESSPADSIPFQDLFRHLILGRLLKGAASMLKLFSLSGFPWASGTVGDSKVELTVAEVESLRSEISDAEEREAHLQAQLEHVDEILKSARLAGYLFIRTRWTELPGEPPIIDDAEVDDWLPRFVVLHGSSIFYYLKSTDLSPQDCTLLSDVTEVGWLPSFAREEQEVRHAFYILTCQGLRFECSSFSEVQVNSWLTTLQSDYNLVSATAPQGLPK